MSKEEDKPVAEAKATAASGVTSNSAADWQKQTISIPIGVLLVAISTVLGTLGGTGVMSQLGGADLETTRQLIEMQRELEDLNKKLDEIYEIVDRAHPRFAPSTPRGL